MQEPPKETTTLVDLSNRLRRFTLSTDDPHVGLDAVPRVGDASAVFPGFEVAEIEHVHTYIIHHRKSEPKA